MKFFTILFSLLISFQCFGSSTECEKWFKSLNLRQGPGCMVKCSISPVDMSNFDCPVDCDKFCKKTEEINYSILKKYGLTDDEIKICDKEAMTCIKAYKMSLEAEKTCLEVYPASRTNDESDACRHYVWAILLANSLGVEKASSILNAHENNPKEPQSERAMDLANNRLGLLSYQKMIDKKNEITEASILVEFKDNLKKDNFIINAPRYKQKGGLP